MSNINDSTNPTIRPDSSPDNPTSQNSQLVPAVTNPVSLVETGNFAVWMSGLSLHTQRSYRSRIKRFLSAATGRPKSDFNLEQLDINLAVSVVTVTNLKACLGSIKVSGLGKDSLDATKAAIINLADFLADLGRVNSLFPAALSRVPTPKAERGQKPGTWFAMNQVRKLLITVMTDFSVSLTMQRRNTAILFLLAGCGLRREEVTKTTWTDLIKEGDHPVLRVHGKGSKMRKVKLSRPVLMAIEQWRDVCDISGIDTQSGPVFVPLRTDGSVIASRAIDPSVVRIIVKKAARAANLPEMSTHDLRRSFARNAYEAGASLEVIRQALGHASVMQTERYINARLELDRAATDIWADALREVDDVA